ncbi:MAG: hypothetical protein M3069_20805 [Chloroflexota bacterium]|nr:hypothetical protein [Chloroflexota bacterium]
MALLSAGADPRVLPEVGFLECLTGLPFGNLLILTEHGPLPLFSSGGIDPDRGLSYAIEALEWTRAEFSATCSGGCGVAPPGPRRG